MNLPKGGNSNYTSRNWPRKILEPSKVKYQNSRFSHTGTHGNSFFERDSSDSLSPDHQSNMNISINTQALGYQLFDESHAENIQY